MKRELVYPIGHFVYPIGHFATRDEARIAVFEYLEVYYNRERLHSLLGYETPTAYEILQQPEQEVSLAA